MLKPYVQKAIAGNDLTASEMTEAVGLVMDGQGETIQIAALLTALRCKGESITEIEGAAQAMRSRMNRIEVNATPLIDTCGTGGSGTGSFNISTAVAFVAASCGAAVAKHGNKAISSKSGSADVLTELGVSIAVPTTTIQRCIEEAGIGFLFAPNHHPALRHASEVRSALGVRTIFNVLGPLTNPAGAKRQLIGVFDRQLVRPIAEVLGRLGAECAWVVHGGDGMDEITMCDISYAAQWDGNQVREVEISPEDIGMSLQPMGSLAGGTPAQNAVTMQQLLAGKLTGPIRDAVIINTAAALVVAGLATDLRCGKEMAEESLGNARPLERLEQVQQLTAGG